MKVGRHLLRLMDTAGIRKTEDVVEKIGVDKAREYASRADLIIAVIDASTPLDENDLEILGMTCDKPSVILLNKSDLEMVVTEKDVENAIFEANPARNENVSTSKTPVIEISAKKLLGIDEFESIIKDLFFAGNLSFNNEIYITSLRQKTALEDAYHSLLKVKESIENGMPEDFYSIDLMAAYESLGSITGETAGEDLVNEIFSKFCMGK